MPLMNNHGGHEPSGDAWSRQAALKAFRKAFLKSVNDLPPGDWQRNRHYIKACLGGAEGELRLKPRYEPAFL